jgi:hypothetical protein
MFWKGNAAFYNILAGDHDADNLFTNTGHVAAFLLSCDGALIEGVGEKVVIKREMIGEEGSTTGSLSSAYYPWNKWSLYASPISRNIGQKCKCM